MDDMVQATKKIALLHRYPADQIKETNAAFPYLRDKGIDVLTFKKFDRLSKWKKFFKSLAWIFYAPMLVFGKSYRVIYLDDSYPFVPILIKCVCPTSKLVIRLGDLHLMYYTSGIVYKILHFFEMIGWEMSDKIVVISQAMAEYVNDELPMARFINGIWYGKLSVALDPVDPKDFPVYQKDNYGTVMFHGVLTKNKNLDMFLEAARQLSRTIFLIVGDGPDRKRLEKIAPVNVSFKGWKPFNEVARYISTCAVGVALRGDNPGNDFVVTSPFLQYGVMGKPCLVTRRKVFGNYQWQFSTLPEMIEKIKLLMNRPGEGKKLKEYIIKNHMAEKIAEEIWSLLLS